MLVIRRRPGESFWVADCVEIEIIEISGNKVKLGIRAPREIQILRSEIKLVSQQNLLAAQRVSSASVARLVDQLRSRPAP